VIMVYDQDQLVDYMLQQTEFFPIEPKEEISI